MTPPPPRLPTAVLWDMDGTLVDTEPYWIEQEHALVRSFGGEWSDQHAHQLVGQDLRDSAAYIRDNSPVDLDIPQIIDRLLVGVVASVTVRLPWRPGAWELLAELRALGVPCALVSMSWKPLVDAVVGASPEGSFAAVVSGDQVRRGKPDPEPYLAAAALLGAPIAECVAIEDSATGMRSAWASGARTIVVPHVVPVPHLAGVRRLSTLSGVSAADLATLTAATA